MLKRSQQAGVRSYRTDKDGAFSFYLDGRSLTPGIALTHSSLPSR
jgi:hypothetical protein